MGAGVAGTGMRVRETSRSGVGVIDGCCFRCDMGVAEDDDGLGMFDSMFFLQDISQESGRQDGQTGQDD